MDENETLQTGLNFYDYHKEKMERFISLKNQKGSNLDRMLKVYDGSNFQLKQELDEQDKAHDIDYAHGLELDDIGDDYEIYRNGLDDETYRFIIKSRIISTHSKGTFKEILKTASNLLGCKPTDIKMANTRVLDTNNQDNNGMTNNININEIDITKITNSNLIPLLSDELQNSVAAGYRINNVNFVNEIDNNLYLGSEVIAAAKLEIDIPNEMNGQVNLDITNHAKNSIASNGYLEI